MMQNQSNAVDSLKKTTVKWPREAENVMEEKPVTRKKSVSELMDEQVIDNNDTHLWMAVMDRAVRDLVALERYRQDPKVMDDPVFRYDYRTLKKWFHSSSMEPGSFNWICSLVSIDPRWALRRLEERLKVSLLPETVRRNAALAEAEALLAQTEAAAASAAAEVLAA
ncbi:MAG: hypothetical protein HQL51_04050 [Magnetococcales bacterium]|nr:hypothetical protein [Magnetococcales bacterium]